MSKHPEVEKLLKEFKNTNAKGGYTPVNDSLKGIKSNLEDEEEEKRLICSQQEVNKLKKLIQRLC